MKVINTKLILIPPIIILLLIVGFFVYETKLDPKPQTINEKTTEKVTTDPCQGRFDMSPEKLRAGITAKTCEEATAVALNEECRAGTRIDLYPDSLAADLCKKEISESNISPALNAKLEEELNMCSEKYKQDDTLYLSLESSCELEVLQKFTKQLKAH